MNLSNLVHELALTGNSFTLTTLIIKILKIM